MRPLAVVWAGALLAAACAGPGPASPTASDRALTPPRVLADGWAVGEPGDAGLDPARLTAAANRIRRGDLGATHSLLVVRRGRLVVEEYFQGSGPDDVHTQQSVTKSVTSLLVGAAVDRGLIRSEGERVLDFFPEHADLRGADARRDAMTLADLLTMRTGLAWSEEPYEGSDLQHLNDSRGDWVRFVLDRPMREAPGTRWQYNSGGTIVLAGAPRRAAGNVVEFARRALFEPLGIRGERWVLSPYDGLPHTGGGLQLRARDMARLGELVLRDGRAGERQVISAEWMRDSARRAAGPIAWPRPVHYGRLWWLFPARGGGRQGPGRARRRHRLRRRRAVDLRGAAAGAGGDAHRRPRQPARLRCGGPRVRRGAGRRAGLRPWSPLERVVFANGRVEVGAFRCPAGRPDFRDAGQIRDRCAYVFPRTAVWILGTTATGRWRATRAWWSSTTRASPTRAPPSTPTATAASGSRWGRGHRVRGGARAGPGRSRLRPRALPLHARAQRRRDLPAAAPALPRPGPWPDRRPGRGGDGADDAGPRAGARVRGAPRRALPSRRPQPNGARGGARRARAAGRPLPRAGVAGRAGHRGRPVTLPAVPGVPRHHRRHHARLPRLAAGAGGARSPGGRAART